MSKPLPSLSVKDVARFFAKIAVRDVDECWPWQANRKNTGYGDFGIGGRAGGKWLAHRVAYALGHGEDPSTSDVDHTCHNPACCNPAHLRLTTTKQNMEHRKGANRNSKSGIRGVIWDKRERKWHAVVTSHGRLLSGGYFHTADEANAAVIALRNQVFTHSDRDRAAQ